MSPEQPTAPSPSIIPSLRYRDAPAAIEWLCRAFGFEERLVVDSRMMGGNNSPPSALAGSNSRRP